MKTKSKKSKGWLRPDSEFPTPLFLVTMGILTGFAIGAVYVIGMIK